MNGFMRDEQFDVKAAIRAEMPATAAFLDDLAQVFGEESVWKQVEKAFAGEATFFAREGRKRIGVRNTDATVAVHWDAAGVAQAGPAEWILEAREVAKRFGHNVRPADLALVGDEEREAQELRDMISKMKGGAK